MKFTDVSHELVSDSIYSGNLELYISECTELLEQEVTSGL